MNKLYFTGHTFLVSDIHLGPDIPLTNSNFYDFLVSIQSQANNLIILGDLFDLWYGDDTLLYETPGWLTEAIDKLKAFALAVPTYFIHGNRDFLIGKKFSEITGIHILPDEVILNIGDIKNIHISHGDQMCLDDIAYIRMRKIFRNKIVQKIFLMLPTRTRSKIATKIRGTSESSKKGDKYYYDVPDRAIDSLVMRNSNITDIIHGHTHKPNIHNHGNIKRYVLPDWDYDHDKRGGYIHITPSGQILTEYSSPT